jgi:hypothetical protein
MKKIKQFISCWRDSSDDLLRRMCGALSPKYRIITILLLCTLFGTASLYLTVSSIYNIGWKNGQKQHKEIIANGMKIEHIRQLNIISGEHHRKTMYDSINNPINQQVYERKQSTDSGE